MAGTSKSFFTAAGLLFGVGAVFLGASTRDRIDLGGAAAPVTMVGLRADRSATVDIPIGEYFTALAAKLREEYVEPNIDEAKLAVGAVRGMVASLGDPASLFYDVDDFQGLKDEQVGKYHGVGVSLGLEMVGPLTTKVIASGEQDEAAAKATTGTATIPKLVVTTVVPGGPADRAGMLVGDVITSVDGHWVVDSDLLVKFQELAKKVAAKQTDPSELVAMRKLLRQRLEKSMLPLKAKERVVLGDSGEVLIVYRRGTEETEVRVTRKPSELQTWKEAAGAIELTLTPENVGKLMAATQTQTKLTLDLTKNPASPSSLLTDYLEVLAPKGTYGEVRNERGDGTPVKVSQGQSKPLELVIKVGPGTLGAARNLASALSTHGLAKLEGQLPKTSTVTRLVSLPNGEGYSLAIGSYRPKVEKETVTALMGSGGSL